MCVGKIKADGEGGSKFKADVYSTIELEWRPMTRQFFRRGKIQNFVLISSLEVVDSVSTSKAESSSSVPTG